MIHRKVSPRTEGVSATSLRPGLDQTIQCPLENRECLDFVDEPRRAYRGFRIKVNVCL